MIDEGDGDVTGPTSDIKRLIRRHRDRSQEQGLRHDSLPITDNDDEDGNGPDNVTCVFVVAFDTRQGKPI